MQGKVGLWSGDRKDTKITLWRRGIPRMVLDMIGKGQRRLRENSCHLDPMSEGERLALGPWV